MPSNSILIDELKEVIDITSRVDERVKFMTESQQKMNSRLEQMIEEHNELVSKVQILDAKLQLHDLHERILEQHKTNYLAIGKYIFSYIFQAIYIIVVCYLLMKMGLTMPAI